MTGRTAALLLAAVLAAAVLLTGASGATAGGSTPGTAPGTSPVGAGASTVGTPGTEALSLVGQTPWVGPGQNLDLRLLSRSTVPSADQGLEVAVYPCLGTVSAFDQALASPSGTPVAATHQSIALAPLLRAGVATLSVPVTSGSSGSTSGSSPGFAVALPDEPGQCGASPSGVYPVRVQLVDTRSGTTLGGLTTFLVYDASGQATHPLMVAVTLPLQVTEVPARRPSAAALRADPAAALSPVPVAEQKALGATVDELASHPGVPVTVETSGQTLGGGGGAGATAARVAAATTGDELTTVTQAPVDVSALLGAGLGDELEFQLARGKQAAGAALARATASGGASAWVTHTPPTPAALQALAAIGVHQVVLPPDAVADAPANGSTAVPFTVDGGPTGVTAIAANSDLTDRMASAGRTPALAAQQVVAEASQMFFEKPNDTSPRGVVAAAPAGWVADPAFTAALLGGLEGNPLLRATSVASLVAAVPVATGCRTSCRLTVTSSSGSGLPARAVRTQRAHIGELATATTGEPTLAPTLGDLVLAGESSLLRPAQQQSVLANTGAAVSAQLGQVDVSGERAITLTSQQGTLPVTIVSTAPYSIRVTVSLASDKLLFPNGQTSWTSPNPVTLLGHGHTNVVPVSVQTRTPGLFTVAITLRVPSGTLQVAAGQISVRSSATSVVGVVLSVAALVVLAAWWIRTSRRRRRQRRADEAGLTP